VILMSSVTADVTVPGPPTRPAGGEADRTAPVLGAARPIRSWPLLALAVPAAAEVWSGWVGIAQKTGFGVVPLLPGIWSSLHLDTAVTLPVGVECYAAYALRAWLAGGHAISDRTRVAMNTPHWLTHENSSPAVEACGLVIDTLRVAIRSAGVSNEVVAVGSF
jgi:hypothetical protein